MLILKGYLYMLVHFKIVQNWQGGIGIQVFGTESILNLKKASNLNKDKAVALVGFHWKNSAMNQTLLCYLVGTPTLKKHSICGFQGKKFVRPAKLH